jgi:hypothetical protein
MTEAPSDTPVDAALRTAALARLSAASGGGAGGLTPLRLSVAVVVAGFAPANFVGGVVDFTLAVPPDRRGGWLASFTRTIFLVGRPTTVNLRQSSTHVTADGDLAWYGPVPSDDLQPLSRLLRAFQGPSQVKSPSTPIVVTVPGPPTGHLVHAVVAVGNVTTAEYLIHVHHLVAEATIRGLIRPGDEIRLDHLSVLDAMSFRAALDPSCANVVQTRIADNNADPRRLRLYGVLSSDRRRDLDAQRTSNDGTP